SNLVSGGVPKDGIPALTDPEFVAPGEAGYLTDDSRVIGLEIGGDMLAIPHNILWYHEIVNLNRGGEQLAVTYCPLTGSSLAFDRSAADGAEFGVSGLLFQNNLVMYDRNTEESLWPQMNREAGCGTKDGTVLEMRPIVEMTWEAWRMLHPDTRVVSANTGFSRTYSPSGYPYGNYEQTNNANLLFDMPIDERRPPKERALGIPLDGGVAFPFGTLDRDAFTVVSTQVAGRDIVVFWDRSSRGAMAFSPVVDGERLQFEAREEGLFDAGTSSRWTIDGRAVSGPLEDTRLEPVAEAYVAFWFAWAAFHPETKIWNAE
ncbi:MAG: DUF3179 domain-containing protein, partial [Rhodothermales bacterium]